MWTLVGKLAIGMPSLLSQVRPQSYNLICLILGSSLSTLPFWSTNLVSLVVGTMGGGTVAIGGGVVSQWSDRWNGMLCETPSERTYAIWDAWGTVLLVPMLTGWWSWYEVSIWPKLLLIPTMNSWIEASVAANSSNISTKFSYPGFQT